MKHLIVMIALVGCAEEEVAKGDKLSDFGLVDQNPTSATFDSEVMVSDYSGQVSAWYFGHST